MEKKTLLGRVILGLVFLIISLLATFFFRNNGTLLSIFIFFLVAFIFIVFLWMPTSLEGPSKVPFVSSQSLQDEFILTQLSKHLDQAFFLVLPSGQIFLSSSRQKDLIGQNWTNLDALKPYPTLWGSLQQSLAIETGATFEWDLEKKRIQTRIIPLEFESTFFGVLVLSIDISHQHNLDQVQTEFLADISHELKTPLAAIMGASDILNRPGAKLSPRERQSFLEIIDKESARMQRLMDELTNLSKLDNQLFSTLIKSEFYFDELLHDVLQVHQPSIQEKGLLVDVHSSCHTIVFLDRDKTFQIFSNLLSNAIRYTTQGGVKIHCEIVDKYTIITFSDSGAGIEPQNLPRIFDRFYRTDFARNRFEGGSGLGLAITRAIIEAHKGTIEVKSELGRGTTFILSLPNLR